MIADAHQSVLEWIGAAAPGAAVESRPPAPAGRTGAADTIVCYLFSAAPASAPRGMRRGPLQFDLAFLVMAEFADPLENYRILDALIGSTAERPDIELFDAGLQPQFWTALGTAPSPALTVRVGARWERQLTRPTLVTEPLLRSACVMM